MRRQLVRRLRAVRGRDSRPRHLAPAGADLDAPYFRRRVRRTRRQARARGALIATHRTFRLRAGSPPGSGDGCGRRTNRAFVRRRSRPIPSPTPSAGGDGQQPLGGFAIEGLRAAGVASGGPQSNDVLPYLLIGRCEGVAGEPVVAGASSGTQVIALRSYLKPFAPFKASLVEFMTRYHLLLFLVVT